ncbi:MAG: hypothetical protein CMB99_16250 [Flavobacteriaceae bacterium]|nr:hypothetical protein [Flavobacteriaceae bacterium]|tara:strand:+ start:11563 stop:12156 length:594 start_codon:yes stop_codon:yes gene_type:complete
MTKASNETSKKPRRKLGAVKAIDSIAKAAEFTGAAAVEPQTASPAPVETKPAPAPVAAEKTAAGDHNGNKQESAKPVAAEPAPAAVQGKPAVEPAGQGVELSHTDGQEITAHPETLDRATWTTGQIDDFIKSNRPATKRKDKNPKNLFMSESEAAAMAFICEQLSDELEMKVSEQVVFEKYMVKAMLREAVKRGFNF